MFKKLLLTALFVVLFSTGVYAAELPNSPERLNKVYESVELVTLLFRLAGGHWVFSNEFTEYQQSLMPAFEEFADHPAVEFARFITASRGIGFDAVMWFALYIERVDDEFVLKDGAEFWYRDDRWTPEIVEAFIPLINDFYAVSGFGKFFEAHIPYFEKHTQRMMDELWSIINFDWFYQFGFGPDQLRITLYPSGSQGGFGPDMQGNSYAVLPVTANYGDWLSFAVHEFAHSFANPLAEAWYEENEEFRRFSNESVDIVRMPFYGSGITMAREYVTRAYTILYMVENHSADLLLLLIDEIATGFPNIETVYSMITDHVPMLTPQTDMLALFLGEGIEYTLGEKQQVIIRGERLYYHPVDLMGAEPDLAGLEHNNNGNTLETRKGDVFTIFHEGKWYLNIDLGENPYGVEWGLPEGQLRKYSTLPLNDENTIASILGIEDYVIGDEQYFALTEDRVFYYQFMELQGARLQLDDFSHNNNSNVFRTQEGDVIIVTENERRYLHIDLGPNDEWTEMKGLPEGSMRKFFVIPLDIF